MTLNKDHPRSQDRDRGRDRNRDRDDVFATLDAKLVLRDSWEAQSLHAHRPLELIAALDGPIGLTIEGAAGPRSAECFLVPPMRKHALGVYHGRVARIYFDPGYLRLAVWKDAPIRSEMAGQRELVARIAAFHESGRAADEAHALIAAWLDQWVVPPEAAPPCDPRIAAVLTYLDQQTTSPHADRRSLCQLVALSPTRFAALFADNTGMSLSRYLIWRRVKIAMTLICAGETITRAAAYAGFSDGPHLSRSCRTTYGCSPSSIVGLNVRRTPLAPPPESGTHLCLDPPRKRGLRETEAA